MPGVVLGKSSHTDKAFSFSYEMERTVSAAGVIRATRGACRVPWLSRQSVLYRPSSCHLSLGTCVGAAGAHFLAIEDAFHGLLNFQSCVFRLYIQIFASCQSQKLSSSPRFCHSPA